MSDIGPTQTKEANTIDRCLPPLFMLVIALCGVGERTAFYKPHHVRSIFDSTSFSVASDRLQKKSMPVSSSNRSMVTA